MALLRSMSISLGRSLGPNSPKQGVIFATLPAVMTVPGATIHTMMHFMDEPEATRHLSLEN